jgi:hypothetical protein
VGGLDFVGKLKDFTVDAGDSFHTHEANVNGSVKVYSASMDKPALMAALMESWH